MGAPAGRTSVVSRLDPLWAVKTTAWMERLRIPHILVQDEQADDVAKTAAHSELEVVSWWDGEILHLRKPLIDEPFEWLWLCAHYGLAEGHRNKVDFGLPSMDEALAIKRDTHAKNITVGWAASSGADYNNLWRLMLKWKMTRAAREAGAALVLSEAIQLHLNQTKSRMTSIRRELETWDHLPKGPKDLWAHEVLLQGVEEDG